MSLFDGVQTFTPAFTGRQLAIEAGKGAGQSLSRGMGSVTNSKSQGLQQQKFNTEVRQYESAIKRLDEFAKRRRGVVSGSGFMDIEDPGEIF